MASNDYAANITQIGGRRVWRNPKTGSEIPVPGPNTTELFVGDIPRKLMEVDILPHFDRFGPIYQFRLMVDSNNANRGFGYLIYFWEKSARIALDVMGYLIIAPGVCLDVQVSSNKSHLMALNIPLTLSNEQIELDLRSVFPSLSRAVVQQDSDKAASSGGGICSAILEFSDHKSALKAKQLSSLGSINVWNRNIQILWAPSAEIAKMNAVTNRMKNLMFCNMPAGYDPDDLGKLMCGCVRSQEIICITPLGTEFFVEFDNSEAADTVVNTMEGIIIAGHVVKIKWVPNDCKVLPICVDFVYELRALCLANYWEPPIFIYGHIIPSTKVQLCAVIIKNNRNNRYAVFFVEIFYENLVEIHSRVCEAITRGIMQFYMLPTINIVLKVFGNTAFIVGAINNLEHPWLAPSTQLTHNSVGLYLQEIFMLSKMSFQLIAHENIEEIYAEYKTILTEKRFDHQFIRCITSDGHILGCVDPIYRRGRALKYGLDNKHMILTMCSIFTFSNVETQRFPVIYDINNPCSCTGLSFKFDKIALIPLASVQRVDLHFCIRPFIEFSTVDTYGPLYNVMNSINISNENQFVLYYQQPQPFYQYPEINVNSGPLAELEQSNPAPKARRNLQNLFGSV